MRPRLTPTEVKLLTLFKAGFTQQQCADVTGKSYNTVRAQTNQLRRKYGVHTTQQLVLKYIDEMGVTHA